MGRKKKDKAELLLPGMRMKGNSIEYRFTVGDKRYSVNGKSPTECMEKAAAKKRKIEEGSYKKGKALTVSEYCERWQRNRAGTVKENTLYSNRILIDRMLITPIDKGGRKFGELRLKDVEPQNVRDLQRALMEPLTVKKGKKEKQRPGMQTSGVNQGLTLLKSIFNTAVLDGDLQKNPAKGIKPMKRTEKPARDTIHRALTREETRKFLETAEACSSYYLPLYKFLLNTGLRLGEAGALLPADISKDEIKIRRTLTRNEIGGREIGKDAKTAAGRRTVPLNAAARQAIEEQKAVNAALRSGKIVEMSKPIFLSLTGLYLVPAPVNIDIKRICEAAGIERFSVHAFRDTFATRCVEANMPVKSLQEIMGHTNIAMTLGLYAHAMDDQKVEQLRAVNFT